MQGVNMYHVTYVEDRTEITQEVWRNVLHKVLQ